MTKKSFDKFNEKPLFNTQISKQSKKYLSYPVLFSLNFFLTHKGQQFRAAPIYWDFKSKKKFRTHKKYPSHNLLLMFLLDFQE